MDGIIILLIGIYKCLKHETKTVEEVEVLKRETRLNPDYLHEENAFMRIANNLGFF